MTRTAYVVSHSISWAASRLIDSHGENAAAVARERATAMAEEGQMELHAMWELVQSAADGLLGQGDSAGLVWH